MTKISKYDLLLQNNASKEHFIYSGLTDESQNRLYFKFDVVPDCPDGEYTYVLVLNNRDDVIYEFKTPLLSTILLVEGEEIVLRDLQPETGLLIIGDGKPINDNVYDESDDNNTIFYYDN